MTILEEKLSSEPSVPAPIFVVGMWRSGTSLFYALLNQHPQIALLYEDDLCRLWPLFFGRRPKEDWPERLEFWNSALSRHQIEVAEVQRDVTGLREACETIWRQYAARAIYGFKSPNYFDCLPRLARDFPNARFIVIWRNPVEICRSVVRAAVKDSFWSKRGMVLRSILGYHALKTGYDALSASGVPVHAVQYETLVGNPSETMERVCSFLNLKFDPRMVSLKDADRSAIYEADHHQMVKSERIVIERKAEEVLSPRVRRKINLYVAFWKRKYGGKWPLFPELGDQQPGDLFLLERIVDRMLYRSLRTFDQFVIFIYCFAPLPLLKKYRSVKGRDAAAHPKEDLVGTSQRN
jgi:hypothetical protein